MRTLRNLRKHKKGINTILAALLMVVIVVVASVMVYAWSTGLLSSLLVKPTTGQEVVNLETSAFASTTNASLTIRNTGSVSVSFVTYYVKDPAGDTYTLATWSAGPTIAPTAAATTFVTIGGSCGSCSLSGSAFTFTAGNYYVTVVTAKGTQFQWTITK